ncbi:MAG: hypothetical protein OEZ65_04665 [Gemmatimonadota bacterium]|nr:hypothetical protein [Gemmatimonadota bacterium]
MIAAGFFTAGGCFQYLPSTPQEIAPGQSVRVRLTPEEASRFADLRLASPRLLEGTVVDRSASAFMLDASVGGRAAGDGSVALSQRVNVPLSGIVEVERKEMDRARTSLLVGGGVALATVMLVKAGGAFGGSEPPSGGGTEFRSTSLFRIVLPF